MAYLVIYSGRTRKEAPLAERDTTIGRSRECVVHIKGDLEISRLHCTVQRQEDGSWLLIDEESRNGTFLNGERVFNNRETTLKDGDEIRIGNTRIVFSEPQPDLPSAEDDPR